MTMEEIRQMQHAQPFQPYRIHMANGRFVDVIHPEFVARSPKGRSLVVYKKDGRFEIIDIMLVLSLEPLNGQSPRRRGKKGG